MRLWCLLLVAATNLLALPFTLPENKEGISNEHNQFYINGTKDDDEFSSCCSDWDEEDVCPLCLEGIDSEPIKVFPFGCKKHALHSDCATVLCQSSCAKNCPICRAPCRSNDPEVFDAPGFSVNHYEASKALAEECISLEVSLNATIIQTIATRLEAIHKGLSSCFLELLALGLVRKQELRLIKDIARLHTGVYFNFGDISQIVLSRMMGQLVALDWELVVEFLKIDYLPTNAITQMTLVAVSNGLGSCYDPYVDYITRNYFRFSQLQLQTLLDAAVKSGSIHMIEYLMRIPNLPLESIIHHWISLYDSLDFKMVRPIQQYIKAEGRALIHESVLCNALGLLVYFGDVEDIRDLGSFHLFKHWMFALPLSALDSRSPSFSDKSREIHRIIRSKHDEPQI